MIFIVITRKSYYVIRAHCMLAGLFVYFIILYIMECLYKAVPELSLMSQLPLSNYRNFLRKKLSAIVFTILSVNLVNTGCKNVNKQ
jgi:hypothetical protein